MQVPSESDVPTTTDLRLVHRICTYVLLVEKNCAIYPQDHPMVRRAVERLRGALQDHVEKTGSCFAVESDAAADSNAEYEEFLTQLRKQLIAGVTILPDVSPDELFEFCYLLRADQTRARGEAEELLYHPGEWKGILVQFFEAELMPIAAEAPAMLRAVGRLRQNDGLGAWLGDLPEEIRKVAESVLCRPSFLAEFTRIRQALKATAETLKADAEGSDMVAHVLQSAAPKPTTIDDVEAACTQAIGILKSLARFLEQNQSLVRAAETETDLPDAHSVLDALRLRVAHNPELLAVADGLENERHLLSFLFNRTGAAGSAIWPAEGTTRQGAPEKSGGPLRGKDESSPEAQTLLRTGFKGVTYDLRTLRERATEADLRAPYVEVLTEILGAKGRGEVLEENWPRILREVTRIGANGQRSGEDRRRLVVLVVDSGLQEVPDILAHLLLGYIDDAMVASLLEETILPRLGPDAGRRVLDLLATADPRSAVRLLAPIARRDEGVLANLARIVLTTMAEDPMLLAEWVLENPACLSTPAVSNLVRRIDPRELRGAFEATLEGSRPTAAAAVVDAVVAGSQGMEQILFAAVARGPTSARPRALGRFAEFPTRAVILKLQAIVNKNNGASCNRTEVAAAVDALKTMDHPEARRFLAHVRDARRWLRRAYRHEIRALLR